MLHESCTRSKWTTLRAWSKTYPMNIRFPSGLVTTTNAASTSKCPEPTCRKGAFWSFLRSSWKQHCKRTLPALPQLSLWAEWLLHLYFLSCLLYLKWIVDLFQIKINGKPSVCWFCGAGVILWKSVLFSRKKSSVYISFNRIYWLFNLTSIGYEPVWPTYIPLLCACLYMKYTHM